MASYFSQLLEDFLMFLGLILTITTSRWLLAKSWTITVLYCKVPGTKSEQYEQYRFYTKQLQVLLCSQRLWCKNPPFLLSLQDTVQIELNHPITYQVCECWCQDRKKTWKAQDPAGKQYSSCASPTLWSHWNIWAKVSTTCQKSNPLLQCRQSLLNAQEDRLLISKKCPVMAQRSENRAEMCWKDNCSAEHGWGSSIVLCN